MQLQDLLKEEEHRNYLGYTYDLQALIASASRLGLSFTEATLLAMLEDADLQGLHPELRGCRFSKLTGRWYVRKQAFHALARAVMEYEKCSQTCTFYNMCVMLKLLKQRSTAQQLQKQNREGQIVKTVHIENGAYEKLMKRNTKKDLGLAIHDLLADHYPQPYYGMFGKPQSYCTTCKTSTEDTGTDQPCTVMDTLADYMKL